MQPWVGDECDPASISTESRLRTGLDPNSCHLVGIKFQFKESTHSLLQLNRKSLSTSQWWKIRVSEAGFPLNCRYRITTITWIRNLQSYLKEDLGVHQGGGRHLEGKVFWLKSRTCGKFGHSNRNLVYVYETTLGFHLLDTWTFLPCHFFPAFLAVIILKMFKVVSHFIKP